MKTKHFKTCFRFLLCWIILTLVGCGGSDRQSETAGGSYNTVSNSQPDIILISIDTLRADHLGCYGHSGSSTPNIDQFAQNGALFQQAFTTIPVTLPAHSSMLTGQIPPVHGVRDNGGDQLSDSAKTLAEALKSSGYQTGAFIAAEPLKHDRGLNQGFDVYDDLETKPNSGARFSQRPDRPAEQVAASFAGWAHRCEKDKPMFAFVHLFDPHWPYEKSLPGDEKPSYLGEISHVDQVLGQLFRTLDVERNPANRIVVITSDHGEGLGEHNEKTHCIFVYDSTLRVPLIIQGSNITPIVVKQPVGIIDIAPTILELAKIDELPDADGISLVAAMESGTAEIRDLYFESRYGEFRFGWAPLKGVRRDNMKFISAPKPEVYDLGNDPGETTNLWQDKKELAGQLADVLTTIGDGLRTRTELSDETVRKLANLGYVSAKVTDDTTGPRPDPKDRIEVYDNFQSAYQKYLAGAKNEALTIMDGLEPLMSNSPQFYFEWAFFQAEVEKWADAEKSYRRCLELEPDYPKTRQNLVSTMIKLKKFKEAESELELLLAREPDNGIAYLYAGFCANKQGETKKAVLHWRRFIELAPNHPDAQKIAAAINGN